MAVSEQIEALPFLARVDAKLRVWELRSSPLGLQWQKDRARKEQVLTALGVGLPSTRAFLCFAEDPIADGIPGQWERVADETWRLPSDLHMDALLEWLNVGSWTLYSAARPAEATTLNVLDPAPPASDIVATASRFGMGFMIVSFHDDLLWTIGLGAEPVPGDPLISGPSNA